MSGRVLAEVCIETADDAVEAERGGADRLELCAALSDGGLTPPLAVLQDVLAATSLPVIAMLRCRGGDFRYTPDESVRMGKEAQTMLSVGAAGLVFGAVDASGMPDLGSLRRIRAAADRASRGRAELVFHRAFDSVPDQRSALDALAEVRIDRVLTAGHPDGVEAGLERLVALVAAAGDRITVMPGGGIRATNVAELLERTGAREIHFSARAAADEPTRADAVRKLVDLASA